MHTSTGRRASEEGLPTRRASQLAVAYCLRQPVHKWRRRQAAHQGPVGTGLHAFWLARLFAACWQMSDY